MSVEYITQKINNIHLNKSYPDTKDMEISFQPIKLDSLYNTSLTICVNIKDKYNNTIYDLKRPSIIYTENESSISPHTTSYMCPSPPRANKNRSFCWSHALE